MPPEAVRTGSFPQIDASGERPSPPPSPQHGTPEWFAWATKRIEGHARDISTLREGLDHFVQQIGRPPIPATSDPGAGMWLVLAGVRTDCTRILERLDAAAAASNKRAGWAEWAARIVIGGMLLAALAWCLSYVSGHWSWQRTDTREHLQGRDP